MGHGSPRKDTNLPQVYEFFLDARTQSDHNNSTISAFLIVRTSAVSEPATDNLQNFLDVLAIGLTSLYSTTLRRQIIYVAMVYVRETSDNESQVKRADPRQSRKANILPRRWVRTGYSPNPHQYSRHQLSKSTLPARRCHFVDTKEVQDPACRGCLLGQTLLNRTGSNIEKVMD